MYVTAISAKRYVLYRLINNHPKLVNVVDGDDDERDDVEAGTVVKRSEHGLGLYISPRVHDAHNDSDANGDSWYGEVWRHIVNRHVFNRNVNDPQWFSLPAVSRFPVRTLHYWKVFEQYFNQGKPINEQVRPYNFYLAAHPVRPSDTLRLVAPFNKDPSSWLSLPWTDANTGKQYRITTDPDQEIVDEVILVKDYRAVVFRYVTHPEWKYDDANGEPCGPFTRGILQPAHTIAESFQYITKDSSSLSTIGEAYEHDGPDVFQDDSRQQREALAKTVVKTAHRIGRGRLTKMAGITDREAQDFLNDRLVSVREVAFEKIIRVAANLAREDLSRIDYPGNRSDATILTAWKRATDKGLLP